MNTEYCKSGSSLLVSEVRRPFSSAHSRTCLASVADLYAAVSRAAPGIPWREFLDMPLAAATHLAAASHRANGDRTERPMDWASALDSISV